MFYRRKSSSQNITIISEFNRAIFYHLPNVMVIGIITLDFHFPAPNSLKSKRVILKRIIERLRAKFNISIAEVDHHDLWQRSAIGISIVGRERRFVNSVIDKIMNQIELMHDVQILNQNIEYIT